MKKFLKEVWYYIKTGNIQQETDRLAEEKNVKINDIEAYHKEANIKANHERAGLPYTPPPSPRIEFKPQIDQGVHQPHYQLSESQYNKLYHASNVGGVAWVALHPNESDNSDEKAKRNTTCQEMVDLEALGLAKDVTESHYKREHEQALRGSKRYIRYYIPTEVAELMFLNSEGRKIN